MASNHAEMYQISKVEQPNGKEDVVLRSLVGDPNRHKPLTNHPAPTTAADQETTPASMYTLETRYRPIPPKVLPKRKEPKVYYIESQKPEENPVPNPVNTKEEPPMLVEQEVPKNIEQEPPETIFLEPEMISQPILYSIVGAKTLPVQNDQTIPTTTTEVPLPLLYTILGQHHPPAANMSVTTANVTPPVIEQIPILYTLVANPRLRVRIQEPVKEVSEVPQQSSSNLYTVVGNPHVQRPIEEPVQKTSQIPPQPSPILYSIVAKPTLTSHIPYTNTAHPSPSTQLINNSSVQPVPILYTIIAETQVPKNIPKENRPPLGPIKRHANNGTVYAAIGNPTIPQSMTMPSKTQPLQPQKQQQQQPPPAPQQIPVPALYPLVGKPTSLPEEKPVPQPKAPVRKKSPPSSIIPSRRISRSLDRQTAPEPTTEPIVAMSAIKKKRQPKTKEPSIPKADTIFVPLPNNERTPRSNKPRVTPWHFSPENTNHQPREIPNYDPLRLPDYISPYAYHPLKPYRDQTVHPTRLPIIKNNRAPRKSRPPLNESRDRPDRKQLHDSWTHRSLERYSVRPNERPRLWDYEDEAGTDSDDDADRTRESYRRRRLREPWIPVW